MVIYLKSIGAGVIGAVLSVIGYVLIQVLFVAIAIAWQSRSGSGGIGAVSAGFGIPMIVALIGFIVGFVWQMRRAA